MAAGMQSLMVAAAMLQLSYAYSFGSGCIRGLAARTVWVALWVAVS
jgi:hypothetical protein